MTGDTCSVNKYISPCSLCLCGETLKPKTLKLNLRLRTISLSPSWLWGKTLLFSDEFFSLVSDRYQQISARPDSVIAESLVISGSDISAAVATITLSKGSLLKL